MDRVELREPDVAVNAGPLVEPAVAEAGVDAEGDAVFAAVVEKVGEVETEGSVAVVVAADEAAVDEDDDAAEGAIELHPGAAAGVGSGDVELAAVPADTGLGIAAAERLVAMGLQLIVADEGELDGPVVRQVKCTPLGIVESGLGEFEIAGLGKVALVVAEFQVF